MGATVIQASIMGGKKGLKGNFFLFDKAFFG